jgi:hypothetical protein
MVGYQHSRGPCSLHLLKCLLWGNNNDKYQFFQLEDGGNMVLWDVVIVSHPLPIMHLLHTTYKMPKNMTPSNFIFSSWVSKKHKNRNGM